MSHPHSSLLLQFFSEKPQSCIAKSPKDTVFGGSLFTLMSLGSLAETYGDGNSPWLKKTGRKIMYHLGNGVLFGQLTILIWWLGSLSYFQLGCEEVFFQHLPRLLHYVSHPTAFGGLWGANLQSTGPSTLESWSDNDIDTHAQSCKYCTYQDCLLLGWFNTNWGFP